MKRLKLSLQHIEGAEVLDRAQLKKILGGDGGSGDGGSKACDTDADCGCTNIRCNGQDVYTCASRCRYNTCYWGAVC